MANRLYIGARYIPLPFNNPDGSYNWLPGVAYEGLTIVIYDHRSFISKKPVPAISTPPSEDSEHWVDAYLYNADVAEALLSIAELQETKADKDGVYESLWAGELISKDRQTDNTPYLFRNTGGDLKRIAPLAYPTLVGASVVENQLCNGESVTVPNGHKYYLKKSNTESLGESTGTAITGLTSGSDMVIDLTQKLGSTIADYVYSLETATAGSGIAWLRSYGFLKGYQAYNSGSIESVEVTGKKVTGFNQWDEEWEVGGIRTADGTTVFSNAVRSTNYNAMIGGATYYTKSPSDMGVYVFFYDADYGYITYTRPLNNTFVVPLNASYFKIQVTAAYGTTYHNDICINISSSRNGEYEPYTSQTYALGNDTLRGIFKLDANNNLYADGDRKEADGTITRRYGLLDLGSLNWTKTTASNIDVGYYYQAGLTLSVLGSLNCILDKYVLLDKIGLSANVAAYGRGLDKVAFRSSNKNIYIIDSAYTDATAFKTAMNGVMLVYELATPTTEQSTPFTSPQVCYPDGTEEFVTENGVPVGHETEYPYDLVGLVENLINIPDVPSTNGTYKLQAVRTSSGVTYNWVTD